MGIFSAPAKLAHSIGLCLKHGIGPVDKLKLIYLYISLQARVRLKMGFFLPFYASVRSASGKRSRLYFSKADSFWAFDEIYLHEIYLPRTPQTPNAVFDLGANVGYASSYFAACYPEAKIFAIEPEKSNFEALSKNCAPLPNVQCSRIGMGAKKGKMTLYLAAASHAHSVIKMEGSRGTEEVDIENLDDFAKEHGVQPDLVKCDVEGPEFEIFGNSQCWKNAHEIMGEVHKVAGDPKKFADMVRKAGFEVQMEHTESASPFIYAQKKTNQR
ncbi:MAG: FkbM family methyltransferase [Candidatus Micrarchaeota archaeon]|nr:FkbM family methyltransferase [Candidatus Micrarchaeota archaeon]